MHSSQSPICDGDRLDPRIQSNVTSVSPPSMTYASTPNKSALLPWETFLKRTIFSCRKGGAVQNSLPIPFEVTSMSRTRNLGLFIRWPPELLYISHGGTYIWQSPQLLLLNRLNVCGLRFRTRSLSNKQRTQASSSMINTLESARMSFKSCVRDASLHFLI